MKDDVDTRNRVGCGYPNILPITCKYIESCQLAFKRKDGIMLTIINQKPFVIISWITFEKLLWTVPKKVLIKEFADVITARDWNKLGKEELIDKIFIEYET